MKRIRVEVEDGVGRVTLARPERKNALDPEMVSALSQALRDLEANPAARVIVLAADGADFCAGADLHAIRALLDAPIEEHEADARALGEVFLALHASSRPTVAMVRGKALAGGAALATACDIVLADEGALFGYPEVNIGFVPAMAMTFLVRCVGEKVAFDLAATGRIVRAEEALQIGLISRVFAPSEFEIKCASVVSALAAASPEAVAATKSLLHSLRHRDVVGGIAEGARVNALARRSPAFREALERFTERSR